jgi:hypothetical protein
MKWLSESAGIILMLPVIMCLLVPLAMLLAYGVFAVIQMVSKRLEMIIRLPFKRLDDQASDLSQLSEKPTKAYK